MPSSQGMITVVTGLPRSGTSMMMHMLEAGGMPILTDNIRKPDEDNPNGYYEFEAVKQLSRNSSWLAGASGKAVKMVYRLLYELPTEYRYGVIFLERKLDEVLASQLVMLGRNREQQSPADNLRLAASFRRELERTKSWLRAQNNFKVLDLSYNNVIDYPESSAEVIERFLGVGLDRQAMIQVVDSTLYRQRS